MNTTEKNVHDTEIPPYDPKLSLNEPKSKALRKGVIKGIVVAVLLVVTGSFVTALVKSGERIETKTDDNKETVAINREDTPPELTKLENITIPQSERFVEIPDAPAEDEKNQIAPTANSFTSTVIDEEARKLKEEEEAAIRSPLEFSGGSGGYDLGKSSTHSSTEQLANKYNEILDRAQNMASNASPLGDFSGEMGGGDDQNMQSRKNGFLQNTDANDDYVSEGMKKPISEFEVKASTIIPVSLITGINSDLPGQIVGQVKENVFDTVSGNHLLIPQGTRVLAKYDSMVAYGQERVLVCWDRLVRPDGYSIKLECAPGTDLAGYAGFADQVDNHYGKLIGGVVLSSLLSVGASASQGTALGNNTDMTQIFAMNVGQNLNTAGQQITRKNLAIQPTITIRPGYSVNVLVNKDMVIPSYKLDY
jgi:type IV secretion system protein VirB10